MKTVVGQLDELFGPSFVSFLRDAEKDTITVSVTANALNKAGFGLEGWRYVMGARYVVRTMTETDWETFVREKSHKTLQ